MIYAVTIGKASKCFHTSPVRLMRKSHFMKKIILGAVLISLASCDKTNKIGPNVCYLSSENTYSNSMIYYYNSSNELSSYVTSYIFSSVLTYDGSGKIISELDNGNTQISYNYDKNNRLILWSQVVAGDPSANLQYKFMYNASGQDTLKQLFNYDATSSSYYLSQFQRLTYTAAGTNNYSERRTYDSASTLLLTEDYLWDNHPNPYLTNPFFSNEPPPSNNVIQYSYMPAGQPAQVTIYTYTYNSNRFPVTQMIPANGTTLASHIYIYTNCK
jgi:YD repeat-containing protein